MTKGSAPESCISTGGGKNRSCVEQSSPLLIMPDNYWRVLLNKLKPKQRKTVNRLKRQRGARILNSKVGPAQQKRSKEILRRTRSVRTYRRRNGRYKRWLARRGPIELARRGSVSLLIRFNDIRKIGDSKQAVQRPEDMERLLADLQTQMEPARYAEFVRTLEQGDGDPEDILRSF